MYLTQNDIWDFISSWEVTPDFADRKRSVQSKKNRFKRRSPDTTAASEEHQVRVAKLENSAN